MFGWKNMKSVYAVYEVFRVSGFKIKHLIKYVKPITLNCIMFINLMQMEFKHTLNITHDLENIKAVETQEQCRGEFEK